MPQNRSKALRVLRAKLFDLQLQASLEEQSRKRKEQIGTAERSERIRTYNFPQVCAYGQCSVTCCHYNGTSVLCAHTVCDRLEVQISKVT